MNPAVILTVSWGTIGLSRASLGLMSVKLAEQRAALRVLVAGAALVTSCAGTPPAAPRCALGGAAVAYDAATGTTLAYGGAIYHSELDSSLPSDGTWAWTGAAWRLLHPAYAAPSRVGPLMAYDEALRGLVLLGGARAYGEWLWDGTTWSRLDAPGFPDGVVAMAADPAIHGVLALSKQTWTLEGRTWTRKFDSPAPVDTDAALTYDPVSQRMVLFQGAPPSGSCATCGNGGHAGYAATWAWSGDTWEKLSLSESPDESVSVIAPAPDGHGLILFNDQGHTWRWDGASWTRLHPRRSPPSGRYMAMAADSGRQVDVLLLAGGGPAMPCPSASSNGSASRDDETWVWDGTSWSQIDSTP